MLSGDAITPQRRICLLTPRTETRPRRRCAAVDPASRQEAQFFAALDGLGAACGAEFVKGAGAVCLDGVF